MTKTELKKNITKIKKLLRSDSYEAGIELIKTLDDPEIKKGTAMAVAARIKKFLKQRDYDVIDMGIKLAKNLDEPTVIQEFLEGCTISVTGYLKPNKLFSGTKFAQPYLNYALVNFIALLGSRIKPDLNIQIESISGLNYSSGLFASDFPEYHKFPIGLTEFKNLKTLNIRSLRLKSIPDEISKLSKLQVLECEDNELKLLPEGLFQLSNLEELNMNYCSGSEGLVKEIPKSIVKLKKLKKLNIGSMKGLSITETIETLSGLISLSELDMSYNSISKIPDNIDKLQSVEYLNISASYDIVPEDAHKLTKIRTLKAVNLPEPWDKGFASEKDKQKIKDELTGVNVSFNEQDHYYIVKKMKKAMK